MKLIAMHSAYSLMEWIGFFTVIFLMLGIAWFTYSEVTRQVKAHQTEWLLTQHAHRYLDGIKSNSELVQNGNTVITVKSSLGEKSYLRLYHWNTVEPLNLADKTYQLEISPRVMHMSYFLKTRYEVEVAFRLVDADSGNIVQDKCFTFYRYPRVFKNFYRTSQLEKAVIL